MMKTNWIFLYEVMNTLLLHLISQNLLRRTYITKCLEYTLLPKFRKELWSRIPDLMHTQKIIPWKFKVKHYKLIFHGACLFTWYLIPRIYQQCLLGAKSEGFNLKIHKWPSNDLSFNRKQLPMHHSGKLKAREVMGLMGPSTSPPKNLHSSPL